MILESREWNAVARHNGGKHVPHTEMRRIQFNDTGLSRGFLSHLLFPWLCYFKGYLKKLVKGSAQQVRLKRT